MKDEYEVILGGDDILDDTGGKKERKSWTRIDKLVLMFCALCDFADGTEVDLPGIMTQQVSCDIELSPWKEGLLQCSLYIALVISTFVAGTLSIRFGRRKLIIISLYLSAMSTIVCAIVADFNTLLLSRILLGFCLGLRHTLLYVWVAEMVSSQQILSKILMVESIVFYAGEIWSSVLGFLLLDLIGWRMFLLCGSLPILIPPIFMLHCCFTEKVGPQIKHSDEKETVTVPNFVGRTTKLGLLIACITFNGWLTTLLVPALIKMFNIKESGSNSDCSVTMTRGPELLLLGLVNFAAIPSTLLTHCIKGKIGFRKLQGVIALIYIGNFALMLTQESLVVAILTNFIAKFVYGITALNICYVLYDVNYFGTKDFALGSSTASSLGMIGGMTGSAMVAFAPTSSVIITAVVLSAVQIMVLFSLTEVQEEEMGKVQEEEMGKGAQTGK
ncbi:D-xylose transporter-like [Bolinopsis microptera]|uniref:D-xylose transporter-like n=1 Tax=Bolinopsis microptera TaxID=2820187 RepID=UPI00307A3C11